MIEKKVEPEKQAEPRQTSGPGSTTQEDVVKLLASILNQVQQQVQSTTPKALEGAALQAVEQFREIVAALALQPRPTITLKADPPRGDTVTLTWFSTAAQTVSIVQTVGGVTTPLGELTPPEGGSKDFSGTELTTFTATAKGPCASAAASVTVTFSP
jgi:hypothetical protein